MPGTVSYEWGGTSDVPGEENRFAATLQSQNIDQNFCHSSIKSRNGLYGVSVARKSTIHVSILTIIR
jgi:hypothetical protein